jgi:release factor glutamine methyltransferase
MNTVGGIVARAARAIDYGEAEMLLAHCLGVRREDILAHPEQRVGCIARCRMRALVRRRAQGAPFAYLVGKKDFCGLEMQVNRSVLIPRPETELLVELALQTLAEYPTAVVADIGTGSGSIAIAIAKRAAHRPLRIIATDVSARALRVARANAARHNVLIEFFRGNLLESVPAIHGPMVITANLPYLTEQQYADAPSIRYEPKNALVAADGGLALYRELFRQIQQKFSAARPMRVLCEIDPSQSDRMRALAHDILPKASIEIKKDLCGRDRVAEIRR